MPPICLRRDCDGCINHEGQQHVAHTPHVIGSQSFDPDGLWSYNNGTVSSPGQTLTFHAQSVCRSWSKRLTTNFQPIKRI